MSGFLSSGIVNATAIPDSVVSRWRFNDDADTSTAIDSEGNNDATINGATYTTNAKEGSHALSFDGNGDDVDTGYTGPYSTDTWWISAWAKFDDITNTGNSITDNFDGSTPQVKLTNDGNAGSGGIRYRLMDASGNEINIFINGLSSDTWYHFVGVRDGDTARLYLDGSEVSQSPKSNSSLAADLTSGNVHFGERPDGSEDLAGDLDDCMHGDAAITDQQVSDLYDSY